jgi:hypothetical protein
MAFSHLLLTNAKKATVSVLYWYTNFLSRKDLEFLNKKRIFPEKGKKLLCVLVAEKEDRQNGDPTGQASARAPRVKSSAAPETRRRIFFFLPYLAGTRGRHA